ncbi:MAG TPA: LysR family transcriptional regulator [Candidatus Faecaligallichristensenella faecipullorum]|nr:LysR family transcriptional regulator [Candidatus Faecaligallichristensenella faecipullorum]
MDIRVLRYFLTVAREESFSHAAEKLFLSQPTLSRQIKDMEEELGVALFIRTNRNVILTKEGLRLRKRAQEIVELMDKTQEEFMNLEEEISGDVYIGGGETHLMREIAKIALSLQEEHPDIRYHLHSGNAEDVSERLDKGLLDFGIVSDPADIRKYDFMRIPGHNIWGLLMPKDHPLAERQAVSPKDLEGVPLIISRQNLVPGALSTWLGKNIDTMKVVGTYNLIFNAALMVEQGLGCAIAFDQLVNTMAVNRLCFRPLTPRLEMGMNLVWKKYQLFSPAAEAFLNKVQETFQS